MRNETNYSSFEELAKAFGCKPVVMKTSNHEKLVKQQETFCSKHICKVCKKPMMYIGGNQMVCQNENCNGTRHEVKNEETGEIKVWHSPSFDLLDSKGSEIAKNIFE